MSLINEALKKAQRQRNEGAADAPPMPGGQIGKRGQPRGFNLILLIGSGALVLVVLSVAVTVYLLNRPAERSASAVASAPSTPAKNEPSAAESNPMVALPPITPPPVAPAATTTLIPRETTAATKPSAPANRTVNEKAPAIPLPPSKSTTTPTTSEVASSPTTAAPARALETPAAVAEPAPPAVIVKPDEGIYQYIDALRIVGVKAAGADSRVLMNDRVYRVNDIVERNLSIRLIKVEPNTLTFSDANGAIYVKNF